MCKATSSLHDGRKGRSRDPATLAPQAQAQIASIGERYLGLMGRTFPVMTVSDSFYTFPRAHAALAHTHDMETLSRESISAAVGAAEGLLGQLGGVDATLLDLEDRIDWHLLWGSMCTFIRDLGRRRVWRTEPLMYLKIVNLCCELNPATRLPHIPALLSNAERNLHHVPRIALEIALTMLAGEHGLAQRVREAAREYRVEEQPLCKSLASFERFMQKDLMPRATESFAAGEAEFEDALRTFVGTDLTAEEVWHMGHALYDEADDALQAASARLGASQSVNELEAKLRHEYSPRSDLLTLYHQSLVKARDFLRQSQLLTVPDDADYVIDVIGTPGSWQLTRSTAGYNCPRGQKRATLHTNLDDPRWHVEHLLTIAHELYPGHHLQGVIARQNPRPLRQQFELPIFYDGWATYAERLMVEAGFWPGEVAGFFCWKLRKFRAARVLADVGLHTGRLTLEEAKKLLVDAHLREDLARREVRRYTTTPAFQLSYAIGADQIECLRARFEATLGRRRFHDVLLEGGDIPWRWVRARMEAEVASTQAPRQDLETVQLC